MQDRGKMKVIAYYANFEDQRAGGGGGGGGGSFRAKTDSPPKNIRPYAHKIMQDHRKTLTRS